VIGYKTNISLAVKKENGANPKNHNNLTIRDENKQRCIPVHFIVTPVIANNAAVLRRY